VLSDEALVQRTRKFGSHYFGELVKRHSHYLFGFGMRLTGGNNALAEDLSQQTFLRAFRYLDSFNDKYHSPVSGNSQRFRNWLTSIAVNCFNDLIETENRYQALEENYEPVHNPQHEESNKFHELVRPLTIQERLIVTLRYVYEYKIDEISRMTDLKPGTVKSKISRALARLREVKK